MSEFITLQVGQCGNQIGSALWPEILQEYGISTSSENGNKTNKNACADTQEFLSSFFCCAKDKSKIYNNINELINDNGKARAICIDMENSVVARFKNGKYRKLFDENCFITNYPGSGNNWAKGYGEYGPQYKDRILNTIQYAVERCDALHGFLLLLSTGGGTGSGLGTYVLKLLSDHYPTVERFVACVYPIGTEDVITCPYNMGFATQELLNNATCVFPVENRALLDIIAKQYSRYSKLKNNKLGVTPFEDMNVIVVNMLLHLTSGSRFAGDLNFDMNDLNTNMIPYPRLNYLSTGFSPLIPKFTTSKNLSNSKQLRDEHFIASCNRGNQLIKLDPLDPTRILLSATILGRGKYSISDMRNYVDRIKSKAHLAPWSKKMVKIGLCAVSLPQTDNSILSIFNTSGMTNLLDTVSTQFAKLYQRKAHVHHYTSISEFEIDHFKECLESLKCVSELYKQVENIKPTYFPRLSGVKF